MADFFNEVPGGPLAGNFFAGPFPILLAKDISNKSSSTDDRPESL